MSLEVMQRLDRENSLFFPAKDDARLRKKNYLDESPGVAASDVWTDLPPIHASSQERLRYPTQKPEALLERIIFASSTKVTLCWIHFADAALLSKRLNS
ncbi:site-specific DNA-methyltransferase [Mesorhizobium australicum]|uniref:Site-specific DNA-methyltransferase n=1 Tax=Mesorhizobium australicum TaxID=536018 RepID=A0ACC6T578_9HYPH|nr:DNA methyltransferase [Mesorhizobium sp. LNHC229A00]